MIKILFVCHGNICRSPMAEFVFKDLLQKEGLSAYYEVASAATSAEEVWGGRGNPIYPPARKELAAHGIGVSGNELGVSEKCARKMRKEDYAGYDYLLGMEKVNLRNMERITGGDPEGKVHLLKEFSTGGEVDDPWYSGDFRTTYEDVSLACSGLLEKLKKDE